MRLLNCLLVVGLVTLSSCATVRGWRGNSASGETAVSQSEGRLDAPPSAAEAQSRLLGIVGEHVGQAEADSRNNQDRIIRKRPYYFKEYSVYPDGASGAEVELRTTESRTSPYVADVELERVRYATRYHRNRDDARLDRSFLRDTGTETLTYEYRNGRWTRAGSFFLAESTEEQVSGEWVSVQRALQRDLAIDEPERGWFGRTWSRITGGN